MRSQSHIMLLAALLTVTAAAAQKDTLVITGVGDIMLGTSYPSGHLAPGDGKNLLKPMRAVLRNSDITFGNYEGTLFNGTGKPKQCKDSAKC
ncbi:MAG TPA: hypothetical protein VFZ78_07655, partial [Flavisolibacter sp.]